MNGIVLNTNTLPEPLHGLIQTEKVRVSMSGDSIRLTPVAEVKKTCPLRGIASDSGFTVDKYLIAKREEKRLEA